MAPGTSDSNVGEAVIVTSTVRGRDETFCNTEGPTGVTTVAVGFVAGAGC